MNPANPAKPDGATMRAAADAVVTLATTSLGPEFLLWEKAVNLGAAEWVWNLAGCAGPAATGPVATDPGATDPGATDPGVGVAHALADRMVRRAPSSDPRHSQAFQRLCETLWAMRRAQWPHATFLVFGLDAQRRGHEIVFRFDLTWDEYRTRHPCEIVWEPNPQDAVSRN